MEVETQSQFIDVVQTRRAQKQTDATTLMTSRELESGSFNQTGLEKKLCCL